MPQRLGARSTPNSGVGGAQQPHELLRDLPAVVGRPQRNVRDSDKRRFRQRLKQQVRVLLMHMRVHTRQRSMSLPALQFPTVSEAQLDDLVPKASPLITAKLQPRDELLFRGAVGAGKSDPLFFTDSKHSKDQGRGQGGEEELIPSCYALHAAPQLLRLVTIHPGVDRNLRRGAPLFLPGEWVSGAVE